MFSVGESDVAISQWMQTVEGEFAQSDSSAAAGLFSGWREWLGAPGGPGPAGAGQLVRSKNGRVKTGAKTIQEPLNTKQNAQRQVVAQVRPE